MFLSKNSSKNIITTVNLYGIKTFGFLASALRNETEFVSVTKP